MTTEELGLKTYSVGVEQHPKGQIQNGRGGVSTVGHVVGRPGQ